MRASKRIILTEFLLAVRLNIMSQSTNIFFFDAEDIGCGTGAGACTQASRINLLTEEKVREALAGGTVGNVLQEIEIVRPLYQIQRGILRVWSSRGLYGEEKISFAVSDQGEFYDENSRSLDLMQ